MQEPMPKKQKIIYSLILVSSIFLIFIMLVAHSRIKSILADPPSSKFSPGQVLDPECEPGSSNCTVNNLALRGANTDITTLSPAGSLIISPLTGKVGISTSSPAENLVIYGALRLGYNASSSNPGTLFWNGSDIMGYTASGLVSLSATTTVSNIGIGSSTIGILKSINGNTLQFKNIGTSSNAITLTDDTINNLVKIGISESDLTLSNMGGVLNIAKGGTGLVTLGANQIFYASSTDALLGLAIGTKFSTSSDILSISANALNFTEIADALILDSNLIIEAGNNYSLSFATSTLYIDTLNQRVGIGTTSPLSSLYVIGTTTATDFITICPTGYVWVPGNPRLGTMPGFCAMKYEAKSDGTTNCAGTACPVSIESGAPWVSISQNSARTQCEALGLRYYLISDQEWMTIAEDILATPINDIDADAQIQLSTGHTDNSPAALQAVTAGSDPIISGCNLRLNLENAANAYSVGVCEMQGSGSIKGYDNTGNSWSTTGYSPGATGKSQLRTFALSNGNVIWDIAGNADEWTDNYIYSASAEMMLLPAASETWLDYASSSDTTAYVTNYQGLAYLKPSVFRYDTVNYILDADDNGAGRVEVDNDCGLDASNDETCDSDANYHGFLRGGNFNSTSNGGVYSLNLLYSPVGVSTSIGFRCVYR